MLKHPDIGKACRLAGIVDKVAISTTPMIKTDVNVLILLKESVTISRTGMPPVVWQSTPSIHVSFYNNIRDKFNNRVLTGYLLKKKPLGRYILLFILVCSKLDVISELSPMR